MASGRVSADMIERLFAKVADRAADEVGTRFRLEQSWQEHAEGGIRMRFREPRVGIADIEIDEIDLQRWQEGTLQAASREVYRVADVLVPEAMGL